MEFILSLFNKWGFIAIVILIILEYACFPLPSEIVLPFAGFIANNNEYSLIGSIIMSVIGGYLGSLVCYVIGYYGGSFFYNKIYNKFSKWQKGLDEASNKFNKYGNASVMICRIIPLCRTYISFLAGLFHQSLFKYSLYSIIGISVWNAILISLGYFLNRKWDLVSVYFNKYKVIVLLLLLTIFLNFIIYKMYKKKKKVKTINGN